MRLRLDEMVPRSIAHELREAGHDVDAVVEHPELRGLPDQQQFDRAGLEQLTARYDKLRGLPDQQQFDRAIADGRAFATYDTADYVPIAAGRAAEGSEHPGLILLSAARFPQGTPASVVKSLAALLDGEGLGASFIHWAQ